jgi:large subunit ribosomal protein L15
MVVRRKKKSRKLRGSRTHGWGFGKRHRGKGSRGGHGYSGVGKRGAQRETYYLAKGIAPIGKRGIAVKPRISVPEANAINLKELCEKLDFWLEQKQIEKSNDAYYIDLSKLGYTKLLAEGKVTKKLNIKCKSCSAKAKQKVETVGGSIQVEQK